MPKKHRHIPAHGRNVSRSRRARQKRYLVVCGGAETEKQYFNHLKSMYNVMIEYQNWNNSPAQLANHAVALKDEAEKDDSADAYEKIWVVVDVDNYHDHAEAQKICRGAGIELIISNPCFEAWLLDHVRECPASFVTASDVKVAAAKAGMTYGPRNKYVNLEKIDVGHTVRAVRNARRHNSKERGRARAMLTAHQERAYAPWTDMPMVVERFSLSS